MWEEWDRFNQLLCPSKVDTHSKWVLGSAKFASSSGKRLEKIVAKNGAKSNHSLPSPLSALGREYKPLFRQTLLKCSTGTSWNVGSGRKSRGGWAASRTNFWQWTDLSPPRLEARSQHSPFVRGLVGVNPQTNGPGIGSQAKGSTPSILH